MPTGSIDGRGTWDQLRMNRLARDTVRAVQPKAGVRQRIYRCSSPSRRDVARVRRTRGSSSGGGVPVTENGNDSRQCSLRFLVLWLRAMPARAGPRRRVDNGFGRYRQLLGGTLPDAQ
jgi:hypothetical protein